MVFFLTKANKKRNKKIANFFKNYLQSYFINVIIDKIDNDVWQENSANKDMLKFISDKLLSNSYKSGFDNIKNDIENAYIYENLQKEKLSLIER